MGILTGKKVSDLLNEENKVNEKYQTKAVRLVEKLGEVKNKEQRTKDAVAEYKKDIKDLNAELATLNSQQIIETDSEKIKELEQKRMEIRLIIQDKEGLINTDARPYLLKEIEKLDDLFAEGRQEHAAYAAKVSEEITLIDQQVQELKARRSQLHIAVNSAHPFNKLNRDYPEQKKRYQPMEKPRMVPETDNFMTS